MTALQLLCAGYARRLPTEPPPRYTGLGPTLLIMK
jgi:hypothetical protein